MNEFLYDLMEQLQNGKTEGELLEETTDSRVFRVLSPLRGQVLESFAFQKEDTVLEIGAAFGVFGSLSKRVRSWDIMEPDENRRAFAALRYPKLRFVLPETAGSYDIVLITDLPGREAAYYLRYLRPGGKLLILSDNPDSLLLLAGAGPDGTASDASDPPSISFPRLSLNEILQLEKELPFAASSLHFPLPNAAFAKNIYSRERLPKGSDFKNIGERFLGGEMPGCSEEALYASVTAAGDFAHFAPSFLLILSGYQESADAKYTENVDAAGAPAALCNTNNPLSGQSAHPYPLYVRYNRSRAPQYQIKTAMLHMDDGRITVQKSALTSAANAHIEGFKTRGELLLNEGLPLRILTAELSAGADGLATASFDYLEGTPLDQLLAGEIADGHAPEEKIRAALNILVPKDGRALHNLDALFENVLITRREDTGALDVPGPDFLQDGTWTLLDYEWVSEEALDPMFLRYRILSYWYASCRERLTAYPDEKTFLGCFAVDPERMAEFEAKEQAFQASVRGGEDMEERFRTKLLTPQKVQALEARLREFTEWNLRLQDEIEEHKAALRKEREVERLSQNHIRNIEKINREQQAALEQNAAELAVLRKHQSVTSRIVRAAVRRLDAWAPAESRKRKLIHLIRRTLRHPIRQGKQFFSSAGRDTIRGDFVIGGEFAEGGILTLPEPKDPLVSIVIPVYNQVAYTYACIRSILACTDAAATPYEVILADDVSTDATREITRYIHGLVISRNSANMGFLKNCNQAAAKARGKYIFFLNNDTKVHENWLQSLVDLISSDESIGMVGSKLVYPDGRLQEAGGIIWSDASGWNYGRLDDPSKPEYNYVKDVDYISGAAIMISRALWEKIGGFDERFVPAYCEDSDLAFEVRRHGKRVVYQPASVVTHFEGISNGTDVTGSGLKRYQVVNQQTFREKWAGELLKQEENTGNPDPFTARDRSAHKPCVVVIDHYVPTWDKDAGSRTTWQYLQMFLKKGFNVKFIGDNFLHEEPYASALEQKGIELLSGPEYQNNIFEWLEKNSGHIDFCYLNRPHIAVKYIDFLKEHTDIKCIFYGHDLHFLRLYREYELTGEIRKKRESDYWKSVEFSVMEKADMVYYPSETEITEIHKLHPEIPARAITAYVWEDFADRGANEAGNDLLFVGGFKHPPNKDAVLWFARDIWPVIHAAIPEIRFLIAGSGADEEVLSLTKTHPGIEVLGFVSDERLHALYQECRLVVVPLRYGAGVKGKVVEALYEGAAIVTTSIGAEGIPEAEGVLHVADQDPAALMKASDRAAKDFADAVILLYQDPAAVCAMQAKTGSYIRSHYSYDAAWEVIREDFTR